jgi:hypothetical protein
MHQLRTSIQGTSVRGRGSRGRPLDGQDRRGPPAHVLFASGLAAGHFVETREAGRCPNSGRWPTESSRLNHGARALLWWAGVGSSVIGASKPRRAAGRGRGWDGVSQARAGLGRPGLTRVAIRSVVVYSRGDGRRSCEREGWHFAASGKRRRGTPARHTHLPTSASPDAAADGAGSALRSTRAAPGRRAWRAAPAAAVVGRYVSCGSPTPRRGLDRGARAPSRRGRRRVGHGEAVLRRP